jgi:hypothetical protein
MQPIPVVCDRCRAEGLAGEDPFAAFGALLDFDPVPRYAKRADGWDAETQRAFIAALSLTGSVRAACRAVGKSAFGVEQLLRHQGSEGFRAAYDEAMAISGDERSRRLAEGLRAVAAEQAGWRPPDPPWANARPRGRPSERFRPMAAAAAPAGEEVASSLETLVDWLEPIVGKYCIKLGQEREARLAGRIAEADFYLRQLTWLEVAIDLASGDGLRLLREFRVDGRRLGDIAETPMSWLLGQVRRRAWAAAGEPLGPEHPPADLLVHHGSYSTEPLEATEGGRPLTHEEQRRAFEERHTAAAEAQIEWEAEARRDYERRRDSGAAS